VVSAGLVFSNIGWVGMVCAQGWVRKQWLRTQSMPNPTEERDGIAHRDSEGWC
jgi:hypothetical protein